MENNEELLAYVKEIKAINKKRLMYSRIATALLVVIAITFAIIVPKLVVTLDTANEAMTNANDAINQASVTLDEASAMINDMTGTMDTFEEAMSSVTKIVDDSSESLKTAFDHINSIDFKGLNDAINDLGNVVEPLSKFFSKFK